MLTSGNDTVNINSYIVILLFKRYNLSFCELNKESCYLGIYLKKPTLGWGGRADPVSP